MTSRQTGTPGKTSKAQRRPNAPEAPRVQAGQELDEAPIRAASGDLINVMVVDAQPLFADSLALALSAFHWDLKVLEDRPATVIGVLDVISAKNPDVTLLDYWMETEAPAAIRMILSRHPEQKIIVLSWFHGPREIEHSFDAGAVGFLPKSLRVDQVAEGIRRAHAGERPVFGDQLEQVVRKIEGRDTEADLAWQKLVDLTPREILVLKMLSLGKGVADIAEELFVSQSTIRKHIFNTLQKLDAHSQLEAIALARRYGLLQS